MKIIKGLKGIAGSIKSAYKRFPIPLALAGISGILMIVLNELGSNRDSLGETITRMVMVLMLGVPITLGLKLLWERLEHVKAGLKLSAYAVSAAFLVMYYFLLLKELEMVTIVRYVIISSLFYLVAACITCWFDRRNYEMYIIRIFSRVLITGIFALIMFGGISGMLASIDGLLEVNVPEKAYINTFYIIGTFFVPPYAFAGIPYSSTELDDSKYPRSLEVLLAYIMVPIICAYTVILYLYFVKILVERTWPQGMVGNLVLWYSIVSIVVIFFIAPVIKEKRWLSRFVFWFTKLIIPCIIMLFIAVGIRIRAYGVTESRYFVVLIGLWALGVFIYWNINGVRRNILLPVSLAAFLLVSAAGPFSAFNVSIRSQSSRLKAIVERYGMLENGKLRKADGTISADDRDEIRSILWYIRNNHSFSEVGFLPDGFESEDVLDYFNFELYDYYNDLEYFYFSSEAGNAVDISGYDFLISLSRGEEDNNVQFGDGYVAEYSIDDEAIEVYKDREKVYSFDAKGFAKALYEKYGQDMSQLPMDDMTIEDENGSIKIRIVFNGLSGTVGTDGEITEMQSADCSIYVMVK